MAVIDKIQLNDGAAALAATGVNQVAPGETHVYFEACEDCKTVTLPDVYMEGAGRTLEVSMTLRNVCSGRRVAVGVALTEMDSAGNEYSRGFRAITLPAHTNATCRDVAMPAISFVLPEDLRVDGGTSLCGARRHFVVRSMNHYVDCPGTATGGC